jgi:23S rRNA (guanosine2251-2'-O)-methyltransferase
MVLYSDLIIHRTYKMSNDPDFIFGLRPVIEAIRSGRQIDKILVKKGLKGELYHELLSLLREHELSYQAVPPERLDRVTRKNHQGIIAWLSAVEYQKIENILPAVYEAGRDPLILLLDGVSDVRNFGAIARSAECMGVDAIVIPEKKSARINADAVKTSAGALHNIAVVRVRSLKRTIENLKNSGLSIIAASEKSDTSLEQTDLKGPLALVMGGEDQGIEAGILALCDRHATISTSGVTSSLNVSVAAGICLYEINRQRRG